MAEAQNDWTCNECDKKKKKKKKELTETEELEMNNRKIVHLSNSINSVNWKELIDEGRTKMTKK